MTVSEDDPVICFCNEIRLSAIVAAMDDGATTLAAVFDATWAGCGPCGGSCQPDLVALLQDYNDDADAALGVDFDAEAKTGSR